MPTSLQLLLLTFVLLAGGFDLRVRRIPNWLTVSGVILGVAVNTAFQAHGLWIALAGMVCALLVYFPLFLLRGMGAGDVKLMAGVGAIVGPGPWVAIFVVTALLSGVAALIVVVARGCVGETFSRLSSIVSSLAARHRPADADPSLDIRHERALKMPHGALIASGSMLVLILARAGEWGW